MSLCSGLGISCGGKCKSEFVVVSHSILHSFCVKIRKESWRFEEKSVLLQKISCTSAIEASFVAFGLYDFCNLNSLNV